VRFDDGDGGETQHENLVASYDPLGDLTRGEMVEKLRQAVLALPTHYREVLVLCELEEMSYADAAAALECAVGTVRSRLHRARAMLAEKMRGGERQAAEAGEEKRTAAGDSGGRALRAARCFA
jgi:RNA polymerase sigma-70 factor (ECF subfamily)